jgi:DNA-directed RNA polymerase subunit RPC12/RpoP
METKNNMKCLKCDNNIKVSLSDNLKDYISCPKCSHKMKVHLKQPYHEEHQRLTAFLHFESYNE